LKACKHYAPFQIFGGALVPTFVTDMVIGLRVYALYNRNKYIGGILATYIMAEIAVSLWVYTVPSIHLITLPGPASINQISVVHLCLATASSSLSHIQAAASLFMQVVYDSITFGLIALKTALVVLKRSRHGGVRALLVKNGFLYYVIVFSAYFTWAMMTAFSPPGLQNVAGIPALIMTCISVNRLTLSLRQFYCADVSDASKPGYAIDVPRMNRRRSWIGTSTFEVTGENVENGLEPNHGSETFELRTQFGGRRDKRPNPGLEEIASSTGHSHVWPPEGLA